MSIAIEAEELPTVGQHRPVMFFGTGEISDLFLVENSQVVVQHRRTHQSPFGYLFAILGEGFLIRFQGR